MFPPDVISSNELPCLKNEINSTTEMIDVSCINERNYPTQ